MEFLDDSYDFIFEGVKKNVYLYRFVSVGERKIIKRIAFSPTGIEDLYNLGFGNLELIDGETIVNDKAIANNKDYNQVLSTVFSCMIHFMSIQRKAKVIFFGNTEHKHFLYLRKIFAHYDYLVKAFKLYGGTLHDEVPIKEQVVSERRVIREKDINEDMFDISKVDEIELFQVNESKKYKFVIIGNK